MRINDFLSYSDEKQQKKKKKKNQEQGKNLAVTPTSPPCAFP